MLRLKHIAIGTSAAIFLAFLAIAVRPSPPPVKLRLVEMSPSGTIDDDGTERWQATLSVRNSSSVVLTLPPELIGVRLSGCSPNCSNRPAKQSVGATAGAGISRTIVVIIAFLK